MHPTLKTALATAGLIVPLHASAAPPAQAAQAGLPLWEAGVGAFGLTAPAYPGARERNHRILPVPYLLYRGEVLRADRSGIGARLFRSERLEFDIGLAGALPSDSDDVAVRAGMPDLGALFEFGPRLRIRLAEIDHGSRGSGRLRAELPLRSVIEARSGLRRQGWTFEPKLAYEVRGAQGLWSVEGNVSAVFGDRRINRYFYEVQPRYANASRAAYGADAGLMLTRVGLFASGHLNPGLRLFGFVRFESYAGSANRDSPLHLKNSGASAGIGFAWTLARSHRRAAGDEPLDALTP